MAIGFLGEFYHSVDAKGRVFVPADFRELLEDGIVIARSTDKCIAVYTFETWEKYVEKLNGLPSIQTRNIRRFIFSSACKTNFDAQGRILLPAMLRDYASIEKDVAFVGVDDHAEIWNREAFEAIMSEMQNETINNSLIECGF